MQNKKPVFAAGYKVGKHFWYVMRMGTTAEEARTRLAKAIEENHLQFEIRLGIYDEQTYQVGPGEDLFEAFYPELCEEIQMAI